MISVLIADDEYFICEGIRNKIKRLRLPDIGEVRTCLSGEEALEICQSYRPQIVITDIRMGKINGIDTIRELGKILYPVQFIVVSGFDDFAYVKGAFQSGATDYLLKPVLTTDLQRVMENACANLKQLPLRKETQRGDLFRLSQHSFSVLVEQSPYETACAALCSNLDACGIGEKCCIAFVAFETAQPRAEMDRRINEVYDRFGANGPLLCNAVSEKKICLLADGSLQDALTSQLKEVIRTSPCPGSPKAAASLSRTNTRTQLPLLYYEAEKQLSNRLTRGYGILFAPADFPSEKKGMQPKIKHLMSQTIQNPALTFSEARRLEFHKELHAMALADLYNFYHYFNEFINLELMRNELVENPMRTQSFFDFCNFEELEAYLFSRLSEYAQQVSTRPILTNVVYAVRKYIDDHFTENLTLSDLADRFFISYSHLSKVFHKTFHMPFQKYIHMLRMEHAMTLLHQPELSIQEIAVQVGYENLFNFSRAFKSYYGKAPSHFRKSEA